MEWLLIPGIMLAVGVPLLVIAIKWKWRLGNAGFVVSISLVVSALLLALPICAFIFYLYRTTALEMEAYYEYVIQPAIVEEYEEYVVVSSLEAAVWQAGGITLPEYNAYLRTTRYWNSVPVIGSVIYPVPDHLKFVQPY